MPVDRFRKSEVLDAHFLNKTVLPTVLGLMAWTVMKLILRSVVLIIALTEIGRAGSPAITYSVQLIRGTDEDRPPAVSCQAIGPRLIAAFRPVLKWKSYWEICAKTVSVEPGHIGRVRLDNGREVEIDLTLPRKRKVTAFQKGRILDRTTAPIEDSMTIIGGDRDAESVWFIVVRPDKPGSIKPQI